MIPSSPNARQLPEPTGEQPSLPGMAEVIVVPGLNYTREEVARWLKISVNTLDRRRACGNFPAGFRLEGSRVVRWKGSVLIQHVENAQQQAIYRSQRV